ncbi:MAG: HAMP domain-containing histidine kinase, partial [Saprospiraceae bacterium]|nr:HAMP domain-containing histidine kinase [Saprospiraceae bacterium]
YAGIIQSQGEHLSNQVERVLQIADVRRGSITLEKQPVDMHVLINEVIADQIESATKSDTVIETDLQAGSSVVLCDRHHMTNILHNLLDNAIKYSDAQPMITVATHYQGDFELRVTDQGIGIAPEDVKKVTDQFYRVPTGNVHNAKGFGLGLHYVKKLCDAHGWDFQITSVLGQGTTIIITCKT